VELAGQGSSTVVAVIDPDSPVLAYVQLAEVLTAQIESGELTGRMPGERELADTYGVAYGTVRRAMGVLRERGLIETVHGRGTFVRRPD